MESEIVYYVYMFEVKSKGKTYRYYFENESDANIARFYAYCTFDYERLTTSNYQVPVTRPRKIMIRDYELKRINVLSSAEELTIDWPSYSNNQKLKQKAQNQEEQERTF